MTFTPGHFGEYGELLSTESRYHVKQRDDLLRLLPSQKFNSILEFGCANGTNLTYFGEELKVDGKMLVGVDISRSTQENYSSIEFHHASVESFLNQNSREFDLVLLSDVLEHIYNPWRVLEGIKKAMTANGVLLLSVPNIENINYIGAVSNGDFFYTATGLMDETHIRFFSFGTISSYLSGLGYAITNFGFRPDFSLAGLRQQIERGLAVNQNVTINLGHANVIVDKANIDRKFGQQVLVCARKSN